MKEVYWIKVGDFDKMFSREISSDEAYGIMDRVKKSNVEGTFVTKEKVLADLLDTTLPGVEIRDLLGKIFAN